MKIAYFAAASALALGAVSAPAAAQMTMPGMKMPAPKKAARQKHQPKTSRKARSKEAAAQTMSRKSVPHHHAQGRTGSGMTMAMPDKGTQMPTATPGAGTAATTSGPAMQHGNMPMPAPQSAVSLTHATPMDHESMGAMSHMAMGHAGREMAMAAALGPYPAERESSGTAWEPDNSAGMGAMSTSGEWMFMAHGIVNLVYDHQSGRRGDDKLFASGMLMGMAQRPLGNGKLQFKAMLSPDPLMGPRGYPLLLASGETANGHDRLIDRQHPHDLFMELSASASQNIGPRSSLFIYAGLPGEPAFGPPSFMHREAILDSPEAPISHHWLDSTHISFGVVTAGIVLDRVKVELSRFNGREPDQHRWNIERAPLDSTAVRLSWNPVPSLAVQGSWGYFTDPEQLEPGVNQKRLSASALYARQLSPGWKFAGTLAWGRKTMEHHGDDAVAAEGSLKHSEWTVFGRAEMTHNRELLADVEQGPAYRVGKVSVGAIRDFPIANHLSLGAGGLFALNFVPDALAPLYGGKNPTGLMGFFRLKLN
jgi:hypothetical protein